MLAFAKYLRVGATVKIRFDLLEEMVSDDDDDDIVRSSLKLDLDVVIIGTPNDESKSSDASNVCP